MEGKIVPPNYNQICDKLIKQLDDDYEATANAEIINQEYQPLENEDEQFGEFQENTHSIDTAQIKEQKDAPKVTQTTVQNTSNANEQSMANSTKNEEIHKDNDKIPQSNIQEETKTQETAKPTYDSHQIKCRDFKLSPGISLLRSNTENKANNEQTGIYAHHTKPSAIECEASLFINQL